MDCSVYVVKKKTKKKLIFTFDLTLNLSTNSENGFKAFIGSVSLRAFDRPRVVGNLRRPPKTCHSSSESRKNGDSEYVIRYAGKIRPFLNFNICITSGTIFSGRI